MNKTFVKSKDAQILITTASAFSSIIIIVSLITVGILFYDINILYDEVMEEIKDFKVSFF